MCRVYCPLPCLLILGICLTATSRQALAATLFSDGSENSLVGFLPDVTDPTVGTWGFTNNDSASITYTRTGPTTNGPTAAYSGNNYLQIGRGPNANDVANVGAEFASAVVLATTSLHAEFRAFMKQEVTNGVSLAFQEQYMYAAWLDETNALTPIIFGDNEGVAQTKMWYWVGGPDFVKTSAALIDNDWNKVTLDWNHTTHKLTLGINDVPFELPSWGVPTSITRLQIFPSWTKGMIFIDDLLIQDSTAVFRPGDVNFDGVVNIFDINLVSSNWGTPGGPTGDANADGNVDIFDINLISSNWTPTPGAAVPEPSALVLVAVGALLAPIPMVRRRIAQCRSTVR